MNSGALNASQELHLTYLVHFAHQTPCHSIQKHLQEQIGVRKKLH